MRALEAHLALAGLSTRKSKRVNCSMVAGMLKNPFYTGQFRWNGKLYAGKHPPIIDKALFERVQAVILTRNRTRQTVHGFAYTGLLKCAECGCAITAEIKIG